MASSADVKAEYETNDDLGLFEEHSEDGQTSTFEPLPSHSTVDYWFGRKYFESAIAQQIFEHAAATTSFTSVDVSDHGSMCSTAQILIDVLVTIRKDSHALFS